MAHYKVLQKAYLPATGDSNPHHPLAGMQRLYEPQEDIHLPDDFIPGPYMQPVDQAAMKAYLARLGPDGQFANPPVRDITDMAYFNFVLPVLPDEEPPAVKGRG
jgi:hypothetical protein